MEKTKDIVPISWTREGNFVEIICPGQQYKNIRVTHINDSGVTICGLQKIDGTFKQLSSNHVISGQTPVKVITEEEANIQADNIKTDKEKEKLLEEVKDLLRKNGFDVGPDKPKEEIVKKPTEEKPVSSNKKDLIYPDGEFTMEQLATLNGITKANAYLKMKSGDKLFDVYEIPSVRGRPTKVYKVKK